MRKIVSKFTRKPAKLVTPAQPVNRQLSKANRPPVWRRGTLVLVA